MYLMYVDESGDTGRKAGSSSYFALSGLVVHETQWRNFIAALLAHRKILRANYQLPVRAEIHASEYINGQVKTAKPVRLLKKHERLGILRNTIDELAKIPYISITNVIVDKSGKPPAYDVLNAAWGTLFQRFENTLRAGNFPGKYKDDFGIVITDAVSGTKLMRLMRRMAVYNYIPNNSYYGPGSRNIPILRVIEDPSGRDSAESLPIQACDVVAYFLKQYVDPNSYIRKKRAQNYIARLQPVLNPWATRKNSLGIVIL